MRCLITGASGFVGKHLSTLLLAAGHEVFGACWPELPVDRSTRVELQLCNLMDPEVALELVRKAQPEWVFHLAGMSSPIDSLSSPRPVYEINFFGALNLLEAVQKVSPQARILLIGSVQCYGSPKPGDLPLTESFPFSPRTPYAVSKAAADLRVVVLDSSRPDDLGLLAGIVGSESLVVANKIDLEADPSWADRLGAAPASRLSVRSGLGMEEFLGRLKGEVAGRSQPLNWAQCRRNCTWATWIYAVTFAMCVTSCVPTPRLRKRGFRARPIM